MKPIYIQNLPGAALVVKVADDNENIFEIEAVGPALEGKQTIEFQSKPINGSQDVDGITIECLLSIITYRLEQFQKSVPCPDNAEALEKLKSALWNLQFRTLDRLKRGVEGTSKP